VICVFLLVFLASVDAGKICEDEKPEDCKHFKWYCNEQGSVGDLVRKECRKTCGICKGPTLPPQRSTTAPPHTEPRKRICGRPDIQPITRVVYGKTAKRGSWPWQILMFFGTGVRCGGSIISPDWIVTAAHCVYGDEDSGKFSIRVGEHDRWKEEGTEVDIKVSKVIRHPQFDHHTYNNDIALLKLERPIKFNRYVSPVCLPQKDVPAGTKCFVTGWGQTEHEGLSHILKQGRLPVVTNKECWIHNNHRHHPVYDGMICAGSGGSELTSACHGDSGGPLVCDVGGVWELHGSVSFGLRDCTSKLYSVFSRTHHYVNWIKENVGKY